MLNQDNVLEVFIKLHEKVQLSGMKGYDPRLLWYLPAAARYHKKKTKINNFFRRFEVAICRYMPFIVPLYLKIARVPLVENPYGLGLLIQSYTIVYKKTNDEYWLNQAKLNEKKLSKYLVKTLNGGLGVTVPLEDPKVTNIPAGAEVALAYLKLYEVSNEDYYFNIADKISHSFLNDHKLKKNEKGICIDYYSNNDGMHVLNSNALAMEVIYRVNEINKINKVGDIIQGMFNFNIYYIESYDCLPYAGVEDVKLNNNWNCYDVYHTGFTIRSMDYLASNDPKFNYAKPILNRTYNLMEKDFVNNHGYITVLKGSKTIDIHGVAEFLRCYLTFSCDNNKVFYDNFNYMFKDNTFYYQRGLVDSFLYMPRWAHAPMMLAISELMLSNKRKFFS